MPYRPAAAELLESRRLLAVALPTDYEQYMLELLNRARSDPSAEAARLGISLNEGLASGTITSTPKQPLAFNANLVDAARNHSTWMIANDTFDHTGQGGSGPSQRMISSGYDFSGTGGWGENIAYRSEKPSTPEPVSTTAQEHDDLFVDANVDGRGHRVNLMKDTFKEIGIGIATGDFQSYNALMATQDFAFKSGNSFLTGVAYDDSVTHDDFYTPGEGLGGVTISARRKSDNAQFTATTFPTGGYSLALPAGTYDVTASGGELTSPVVSNDVAIGSLNVKRDFLGSSNTPTPTPTPAPTPTPTPTPVPATGGVKGRLFNDLNANGKKEGREPGLTTATVYLDENQDGSFNQGEPEASVAADGSFAVAGLEAGVHRVGVVVPDGSRMTVPADGFVDVTVKPKKTARVKPIGLTSKAIVSGITFNDADANGSLDQGELPLKKRRVFADVNADGLWDKLTEPAVSSDKTGSYALPLDAGTYTIRSVPGKGYTSTLGQDGLGVTVAAASTSAGHAFGETRIVVA